MGYGSDFFSLRNGKRPNWRETCSSYIVSYSYTL
jgi:hypothetical protein